MTEPAGPMGQAARGLGLGLAGTAQVLYWAACAALVAIVVATVWEVVARYAFDAPTRWASDAVGWFLAASVALALPEVTRRRGHVAIGILVERLGAPPGYTRLLAGLSGLVCLGTAWIVSEELGRQLARGVTTSGAMPIPKAWITGCALIGFAGSGLAFVAQALARPAMARG